MNFRPVYLDSSAVVKLVLEEPETDALVAWLSDWPDRLTSALTDVEMARTLRRRQSGPVAVARARAVLGTMTRLRLDTAMLERAAAFKDPLLRSLDAIHLGAALSIGDYPEAFVTYDERLVAAARRLKMKVASPA